MLRRTVFALPVAAAALKIALLAGAATLSTSGTSEAHQAPTGWAYPKECCSNMDCREVSAEAISERPGGYVIEATGEQVGYSDPRIRQSPDGVYHWCSVAGGDDSRTICLFVPPQGY